MVWGNLQSSLYLLRNVLSLNGPGPCCKDCFPLSMVLAAETGTESFILPTKQKSNLSIRRGARTHKMCKKHGHTCNLPDLNTYVT